MTTAWPFEKRALLLALALASALAVSLKDTETTQRCFVDGTYYLLLVTLLCWGGTHLYVARELRREQAMAWLKENWLGILIALGVTLAAAWAVEPALRMLSDEANLVGTSKNLFASKTATFTVSGKNYYDSYWDVDVAIDRRPALFPFLVSLLHAVSGYTYKNAFVFNLLLLPAFVLLAYRLAKSLGGEVFGVASALLVAAHPITLITVRSAGFDFLTVVLALLVIKNVADYLREPSAAGLAITWLNLCLLVEARYETALFLPLVVGALALFKTISRSMLRPFALVYALTPVYLAPRLWQAILRGSVPEQEAGAVTFSLDNFLNNSAEYFRPIFSPMGSYPAHAALLIALGVFGAALWLRHLWRAVQQRDFSAPATRFGIFLGAWVLGQAIISFTYVWGRAQYPSAARLMIALDTFFSFAAAWVLATRLGPLRALGAPLTALAVLIAQLPVAAQHRLTNRLTQTRESATTWKFFENLGEKRILIVTDRPNHFTIMNYGAMSFEAARRDPYLFTAFARHLFYDIYVIQQIKLSTNQPLPGYEIWQTRKLDPVLEFQNDADVLVRVSRVAHETDPGPPASP